MPLTWLRRWGAFMSYSVYIVSNMKKLTISVLLLSIFFPGTAQTLLPYRNPALPIEVRVKDLVSRMTPEEKFWQLFMIPGSLDGGDSGKYIHGIFGFQVSASAKGDPAGQLLNYSATDNALLVAQKINGIQHFFMEKTRLGIPIIAFDEALHGLVREGATVFPQSIGLAASFDTLLMRQVAEAIATETKARGIRDILGPVINIASDVRWGRVEETFGEDPFLTSRMAVAYVKAFEQKGIITTPKHFIANQGDGGRDSYPINFNERLLDELYFPPFRACFQEGGSRSVMTAYNSLNGVSCSSNKWLLEKKLKGDWNFKGFVISDANAVGGDVVLHLTAKDYAQSGEHAVGNGLDVIFQTDFEHHKLFMPPFLNGSVDSNRINDAVSRVLRAKFELGLFEHPYTSLEEAKEWMEKDSHKYLARHAAFESMVLLKNEHNTLPLSVSTIKKLAVIGEDAVEARLGGYSGPGNHKVSILEGIRQKAGSQVEITYEPGCGRKTPEWVVIPSGALRPLQAGTESSGLNAYYFNNLALQGKPVFGRTDRQIDFSWTLSSPDPSVNSAFFSARWEGLLQSPGMGTYRIGLDGDDGFRLYIDNTLVIDNWQKLSYHTLFAPVNLKKGTTYAIRVEFYEPLGNAHIRLIWDQGADSQWDQKIEAAVKSARSADVAVVVAGITEGEFQDRAMLGLPGHQEELIERVAATGKPVIVLLVGGSAITMNHWLEKVSAVLDVWYPGEEGGHSVAHVLFGDYSPAGRLPVTFPVHEAQLPLVYNHQPTGRGDDYNNLSGLPLFPFGFGLSYTHFDYDNLELRNNAISVSDSTVLTCNITNTGNYESDEVVQLYIRDMIASVSRPVMELKGFTRIHLKPGETRKVAFAITPAMLSILNGKMERVVEGGNYKLMIGSSSRDIRLEQTLRVRP